MVTIKGRRRVFTGKVTRVDELDLDFGNGRQSTFEIVTFNTLTGVSAIPVIPGGVRLIRHYQAGRNEEAWSLPTGGLNPGEDPAERMQTELQEELGYQAGKLTLMVRSHVMPGYIGSEAGYLYLAEDLTPSRLPGDEDYSITIRDFTWDEIWRMVKAGNIMDHRTLLALLWYDKFHHHTPGV